MTYVQIKQADKPARNDDEGEISRVLRMPGTGLYS